jgi:hypothetical protein
VQVVFDGARLGTGLGSADALLVHAREEGHLLGLWDAIESACRDLLKVAASLIDAVATSRMAHGWDELEVVRLAELPGRESNVRLTGEWMVRHRSSPVAAKHARRQRA